MVVVGLADNKANSPQLELEFRLRLATISSSILLNVQLHETYETQSISSTIHIRCDRRMATLLVDKIMKTGSPETKVIVVLRCELRGSNYKA